MPYDTTTIEDKTRKALSATRGSVRHLPEFAAKNPPRSSEAHPDPPILAFSEKATKARITRREQGFLSLPNP